MATIGTGGHGNGRKPVDMEIPLIPFIDLLLCCVMFLLVTSVWNSVGVMRTNVGVDGPSGTETDALTLQMGRSGFVLSSTLGDSPLTLPAGVDGPDYAQLAERLEERHRLDARSLPVHFSPDDDVFAEHLVATLDVLSQAGYAQVSFPAASAR